MLRRYGRRAAADTEKDRSCRYPFAGRYSERHEISASDDTVRLASGVTYNELLASDVLRLYRGLRRRCCIWRAAIRAVATPVGNICTAAPAADCTTMLFALGASAVLRQTAARRVPLDAFSFRPTRPYVRATSLSRPLRSRRSGRERGRLLPAFPAQGAGYRQNSHRLPRAARRERIAEVSLSLGALNPTVVHAAELEGLLVGKHRRRRLLLPQ